ncbi:ubiquinol-cytochrome c reductase complex assembly factor 1 [Phyllostomus discolor]|uniref:Ubiquinol-cytochrome c reductase complex assembly factor 1 n=1 Tax=Phyllostomus discolor TaxID=89673 RepID=A0A833Z998_9CHIR|nr:ubiquinol-cytochrome c reductase complex assembly factor 1 [Phyllostomus discolor]
MCLVRMKQEGRTGKYMCRIIVHFMWEDVEQRGRVMGVNPYILKKNMMIMTNNFYAAILGYDEGLLSDDHGLAAALWRMFFNQKCEDPRQLELLVEYVRKQVSGRSRPLQSLMESRPFLRPVEAGRPEHRERLSSQKPA